MNIKTIAEAKRFKGFIIYGAGVTGKVHFEVLREENIKTILFLDRKLAGQNVNGVVVRHPDENFSQDILTDFCLVISIADQIYKPQDIAESMKRKGFHHVWYYDEFYSAFHQQLYAKTNVEYPGYTYYMENPQKMEQARLLMEDDISRALFDHVIAYKKTLDFSYGIDYTRDTKYFPKDIDGIEKPEVFVDMGVYSGNDILSLYDTFGQMSAIYAFEPDPTNFSLFPKHFFEEHQKYAKNAFCLLPCANWNKTELLRFHANQGTASEINENGDIVMQAVSLDDILYDLDKGYIVMDIEGAEYAALQGAKKLIQKYHPTLGVAIMHKSSDLCEIPLLLKEFCPNYRFYLRAHAICFNNMVLYAVPQK